MASFHRGNLLCEACQNDILDEYYTRCSEERCSTPFYHNQCLGATSAAKSLNWMCAKCRRDYKKGDYPSTSRSHADPPYRSKGKSKRSMHHENPDFGPKPPDPRVLSDEVRMLRKEVSGLTEQFSDLSTSVSLNHSRLDDVFSHLSASENRLRQVEYWEIEIIALKTQVAVLQENLRNQIELIGIPETHDENLMEIVATAAEFIGVEFEETDLDWITRVGPKNLSESGKKLGRPVVMRFVRRVKRDEFLKAGKLNRNLHTKDLNIDDKSQRVYINERLSRECRYLFHEARCRAKQAGYKFCWTQNGNVFVRKREGYPAIRVLSHYDLMEKLGTTINATYYTLQTE